MTTTRSALLARLSDERFDVLIIGGGLIGAGIARDAAIRGLRVALVEQGDFASGASSKTSKITLDQRLVWGGSPQYVKQALNEQAILSSIAPGILQPANTLIPVYHGDSHRPWQLRCSLMLRDLMGQNAPVRPHRMVSARRVGPLEPHLGIQGLKTSGMVQSYQVDDSRLCLANVLQAVSLGAVCCNYTQLGEIIKVGQKVCGGTVVDRLTGQSHEIQAKCVINATGSWSDEIRRLSDDAAPARTSLVKRVHAVVRRLSDHVIWFEAHRDKKPLFIAPWGRYSLIGAVESPFVGSIYALRASVNEISYLLDEVNRIMPAEKLAENDIVATFAGPATRMQKTAGLKPLPGNSYLEMDASGLISVYGGDLITFRATAESVMDYVVNHFKGQADVCITDEVSLMEDALPVALDYWKRITQEIGSDTLADLLTRYGVGATRVLQTLERDLSLKKPICGHHGIMEAEVVYFIENELACTITDVLARRTHAAWSSCQGLDALPRVVELFERYTDFSEEEITRQMEDFHRFAANSLSFHPLISNRIVED